MTKTSSSLYCQNCGNKIFESAGLASEDRSPCPFCGSKNRSFNITISDTITIHEMLGTKAKRPGDKRPFIEQKAGEDFHRDSQGWRKLERIIDRDNDSYKETITDPKTGEIFHAKDEPLSEHQGYGTAKLKNNGTNRNQSN